MQLAVTSKQVGSAKYYCCFVLFLKHILFQQHSQAQLTCWAKDNYTNPISIHLR